jgi:hypothetical protein
LAVDDPTVSGRARRMERLACGKPGPGANRGLRAVNDRIVGRSRPMDRTIDDRIVTRSRPVNRAIDRRPITPTRVSTGDIATDGQQHCGRKHGEERRRHAHGHCQPLSISAAESLCRLDRPTIGRPARAPGSACIR